MKLKKLLNYEWDAIAGIVAAVAAVVLDFLHIVPQDVVLSILLALMGLLFINFMRHSRSNEVTAEHVEHTAHAMARVESALQHPGVVLVGPRQLRTVNESFVRQMSGDTIWFNVCLSMYRPPHLFDALVRPAIENAHVTSLQFVLDESQRAMWHSTIQPRIASCEGSAKVREPRWFRLPRTTSFILSDNQVSGGTEALLSFWGEPFMAQTTGHDVPRFIFHIQRDSELLPHLVELQRKSETGAAEAS